MTAGSSAGDFAPGGLSLERRDVGDGETQGLRIALLDALTGLSAALGGYFDIVNIRRQPGNPQRKVINFVGHSMGAAALFYLNPINWQHGEETRYALSPALLLEDEMHSAFYAALGTGIGIVGRVGLFKIIERAIKPSMLDSLCEGATDFVKQVHSKQYDETPRGITAAALVASMSLRKVFMRMLVV